MIAVHTQKFPPVTAPTLRFDPVPYETLTKAPISIKTARWSSCPCAATPGSVGLFVDLSPTRRLFYVGDTVDDERGFEEHVGKSLILRDSDNDMALADQVVGRLSDLHEKVPGLAIIPAHSRNAYKKFFPSGPLSCIPGQ